MAARAYDPQCITPVKSPRNTLHVYRWILPRTYRVRIHRGREGACPCWRTSRVQNSRLLYIAIYSRCLALHSLGLHTLFLLYVYNMDTCGIIIRPTHKILNVNYMYNFSISISFYLDINIYIQSCHHPKNIKDSTRYIKHYRTHTYIQPSF